MKTHLIPEPKSVVTAKGSYTLPSHATIGIQDADLMPAAELAGEFLPVRHVRAALPDQADTLRLACDATLPPGGYTLTVTPTGIDITGQTPAAVSHGLETLRQLRDQCGSTLPCLAIKDWPDFADRGIYYDVCRGRVPTLERLIELAEQLARYKINHLQLYIEHTFIFRRHPKIGRGASPLTPDDILTLDAFCAKRGIELVPSLAAFGHLATVLKYPEYRHMAEDLGTGTYVAPEDELPRWFHQNAWTLSPACPDTYRFLDELFAEFLPLFRSSRFNVCCDETWDLGLGQSYDLCRRQGKGKVYLDHLVKVRDIAARYGKSIMFWGDIIRHYPDLISSIPPDVTVLDWGYAHDHPADSIADFKQAGLPFYACPGTSSWVSLFPRLPVACANTHRFAAAGHKHGAQGLLVTDWGDGGHFNFMELSWHGYLFGAEQGWNTAADTDDFTRRFSTCCLRDASAPLVKAIDTLGDIATLGVTQHYQSIWQHVFFASPDAELFTYAKPVDMLEARNGDLKPARKPFNAAMGRQAEGRALKVRDTLAATARKRDTDPLGILPYWIFAADTIAFAARKLTVLGPGGTDTPAARRKLKREQTALMRRFEKLWMARNRRSEIRITLNRYRNAIESL